MPTRLEILQKMTAAGSSDPFVWYGLAMELRSLGRDAEAEEAFKSLRERFPAYVPQYLMAAQLFQRLGRVDDAREAATEGLARARAAGESKAVSELEGLLGDLS